MTDYTEITEGQTNPGAPLTSALVKQLRDNPKAIGEGAAGAPRIVRGALDTNTNSVTFLITSSDTVEVTMDAYSFMPATSSNRPDDVFFAVADTATANESSPKIKFTTASANTSSVTVEWRYIEA